MGKAMYQSAFLSFENCLNSVVSGERCVTSRKTAAKETRGAIHSTKIRIGPTGKRGPPQKVDQFFRNFSGWTEPIH